MKKISKKIMTLSWAMMCSVAIGSTSVFAASTTELVGGVKNFKGSKVWDEVDEAPILKVEIDNAYKLKGKQEKFQLELNNAIWFEGRNTTLSISNSEGIEVYEGYVSTETDTLAEVVLDIPRDIQEGEKIMVEIPLLIKIRDGIEEVSVAVKETDDEDGLIEDTVVAVAITSSKQMSWRVGEVPTIGEGEVIAPIYLEETKVGILGSREIEFTINLKNRYLSFGEPTYKSKTVNNDTIDYILALDDYVEYGGGFKKENQTLRVSMNKNGKTMRVRISGSLPTEPGKIVLKNIPIISNSKDISKEKVIITLQSDALMFNNQEAVVGYFDPDKETDMAKEEEEVVQEEEEITEEDIVTTPDVEEKVTIKFQVGADYYTIDGKEYGMDGKTYIKDPGYTMVPVRYVAQALGVNDINFKEGKVAFTYNNQFIELTTGSTQATVDGTVVILGVPLELIGGRVYAPMGEVAKLLSVDKVWEKETQSACFTK